MQILEDEAKSINCKLIVEGANGPTSNKADEILKNKNIEVLPDIFANGGGVIVSYYEWLQNNMNQYYDEDEIYSKLKKKMQDSYYKINEYHIKYNCTLREAAYLVALEKLDKTYKSRGI